MLKVVQQNNGESACDPVFASPGNHTQLMLHAVISQWSHSGAACDCKTAVFAALQAISL